MVKSIPLPWSRFHYIEHDLSRYALGVDVTVRTSILSLQVIPDYRLEKLHLIDDLHDQGLNSREIADHLNQRGIRSPKGGTYSSKLVWGTLNKFKRRQERMKDTTFTIDAIYPVYKKRIRLKTPFE